MIRASARQAAKLADFDWKAADPRSAAKRLRVPVFLIHGTDDTIIPPYHSEALAGIVPPESRLWIVSGVDHIRLPLDLELIGGEVREWFSTRLAAPESGTEPPETARTNAGGSRPKNNLLHP